MSGSELVPAGFRLRPDAGARLLPSERLGGGTILVGGSPTRVLRLTAGGARQAGDWLDGKPVGLLWGLVRTVLLLTVIPPLVTDRDLRGLHDRAANTIVIRL